ncbi:hypothetical protein J437_LFUL001520 [Ladona fulva]|uniref:Uncharacterized protein n=1 Tax=Ladona fulva TaxID=123851 RepID=A0A8K0JX69_LADFU|nr:hypothetical protein J437_LFUL001520 [Ladona fulva]
MYGFLYGLRRLVQGDAKHPRAPLGSNFRPPQPLHHRPVRTNIEFTSQQTTNGGKYCPSMHREVYYKGFEQLETALRSREEGGALDSAIFAGAERHLPSPILEIAGKEKKTRPPGDGRTSQNGGEKKTIQKRRERFGMRGMWKEISRGRCYSLLKNHLRSSHTTHPYPNSFQPQTSQDAFGIPNSNVQRFGYLSTSFSFLSTPFCSFNTLPAEPDPVLPKVSYHLQNLLPYPHQKHPFPRISYSTVHISTLWAGAPSGSVDWNTNEYPFDRRSNGACWRWRRVAREIGTTTVP